MASMRQIRSRIRVAKNIQQITKAMKMVAAARLRRAQDAVVASRPYSNKLREVMGRLAASGAGAGSHPLMRPFVGTPRRIGVLLITGDRGLCGSFNTNAIRRCNEVVRGLAPDDVRFVTVGRRGASFFRRRGYTIVSENSVPATGVSFAEAREIAHSAATLFESGDIDVVYLVYTQFVSAMTQRPQVVQLMPVAAPDAAGAPPEEHNEIIFEPEADEILVDLVPRYIETLVFQAIVESTASEHGARMTSMSSATDNAGKMISSLTLSLNRARQAAITKEIAEIVGGADALKG
jgi:F-type H+-transporting ATPase subunit gamma